MGQETLAVRLSLIQAIETTTRCNRDCDWCANRYLDDKDMSPGTFLSVLFVLRLFKPGIIAMNGCGDPMMDPNIYERVDAVRNLGYKPRIITNGDMLNTTTLGKLKEAGVSSIMISPHSDIGDKRKLAKETGLYLVDGYSPVKGGRTHNWAGQLDFENELRAKCNPKLQGRGYINVDGFITQCCLDYEANHPIGHVLDGKKLLDVECVDIPLCDTCEGSP